ncbi:MAG: alpha/beta fold hydrolase [Acidimicrobiaceae bacterium]|nr:alpha/beta fold hydrolase [Acidimicrobiaceae bacterium]
MRTPGGRRILGGIDIGRGPTVVLLQGFGLRPRTYLGVAKLLARRCRVLVPPLFAQPGCSWSAEELLADLEATIDYRGIDEITLIGHSFGGALELNFAARHPERVTELVFVDTLAMSREWTLAVEALHPMHLLWMATPRAAIDFGLSLRHPLCLARAGWWGFRSDRLAQVEEIAAGVIPRHVLWADRDSLLSRADGSAFAEDLGADFTVVHGRNHLPVDHDWIYRHPSLLLEHLERLGVRAILPGG